MDMMAETGKPSRAQQPEAGNEAQQETSIPAIRHVGKTLESDPHYFDLDREGGDPTPEAQISTLGAAPDSTMSRGATDLSADVASTEDAAGARQKAEPEPLKTRLPGDTSSDPHTDLGPDNATTVQRRGE